MRSLPISAIMKAKRTMAQGSSSSSVADGDDPERVEKIAAARERLAEMMRKKKGLPAEVPQDEPREARQERERREKVKRADKHACVRLVPHLPAIQPKTDPCDLSTVLHFQTKRGDVEEARISQADGR
jgi:hypothetical protein